MRKIIKFIQSPLSIDSFIRSFETGTWDDRAKFIVVIVWTCDCIDDDYSRITRAHLIKHQNKLPVETEKHVFTKVNNENDNADFHDIKVAPRSRALLTSASLSDYSGWRQTKQQRRAPKMNIDMIRTTNEVRYEVELDFMKSLKIVVSHERIRLLVHSVSIGWWHSWSSTSIFPCCPFFINSLHSSCLCFSHDIFVSFALSQA